MGGIAGLAAPDRGNLLRDMMGRLAHRGKSECVVLERPGLCIAGCWNAAEAGPAREARERGMVWDGLRPPDPDEAALAAHALPFALAALGMDGLYLARDRLGLCPLYLGKIGGALAFASEVKALEPFAEDIREFPPGRLMGPSGKTHAYALEDGGPPLEEAPGEIAARLRFLLEAAVEATSPNGPAGAWLSGGLDSSLVSALASRRASGMHSFVAGIAGAPDLESAEAMARHLGTRHHAVVVRPDKVAAVLPEVVRALESFDALLVRSSVLNYLAAREAAGYVGAVFSGEGGDELFAGYAHLKEVAEEDLPTELEAHLASLHNTAFQRVDRCARAMGLTPLVPFADPALVAYAARIPARFKIMRSGGRAVEKWILREAARGLLPEAILDRPKAKFWEGGGIAGCLAELAEGLVSDGDFRNQRVLENGWELGSKEELLYYRIFSEAYGRLSGFEWMGRTPQR